MALTTEQVAARDAAQNAALVAAVETLTVKLGLPAIFDPGDVADALHDAAAVLVEHWRAAAIALEGVSLKGAATIKANKITAAAELAGITGHYLSADWKATHLPAGLTDRSPLAIDTTPKPGGFAEAVADYIGGKTDDYPATHGTPVPWVEPITVVDETHTLSPRQLAELAMHGAGIAMHAPERTPDRLTWAQVRAISQALQHRDAPLSYTTITTLGECGLRWALDHAHQDGPDSPHMFSELPAWWNAGGNAFHHLIETFETSLLEADLGGNGGLAWSDMAPALKTSLATTWLTTLEHHALLLEQESGVPRADWRVAKNGLENGEWWAVEGLEMLRRYVDYWAPRRPTDRLATVGTPAAPAIEVPFELDADGVMITGRIDQVWFNMEGNYHISDLKAGSTTPDDVTQLGIYAHAWARLAVPGKVLSVDRPISGGYFMTRQGSHDLTVADLRTAVPWDQVTYLAHSAMAQIKAGAFLPHVQRKGFGGCGQCGHAKICPALAR